MRQNTRHAAWSALFRELHFKLLAFRIVFDG